MGWLMEISKMKSWLKYQDPDYGNNLGWIRKIDNMPTQQIYAVYMSRQNAIKRKEQNSFHQMTLDEWVADLNNKPIISETKMIEVLSRLSDIKGIIDKDGSVRYLTTEEKEALQQAAGIFAAYVASKI